MKIYTIMLLILFGICSLNVAQEKSGTGDKVKMTRNNVMSNVFGVSVEGGLTMGFTDYSSTKMNYNGKASLEYYLPSSGNGNFGLRLFGQTGKVSGTGRPVTTNPAAANPTDEFNTKFDLYGGGVFYAFSAADVAYPWIGFGVSNLWFYPKDANGIDLPGFRNGAYDIHMLAYNGDVGVKFAVSKGLSININAGIILGSKDFIDDIAINGKKDMIATGNLGLSYYFGRDKDTDQDGISDSKDACPNTPIGVKVDEFGCPVDSDNDGVADYLDKCSDTPSGVKVDASGCPLDSDNDGVPDYLDKCSDTPSGAKVDESGCPVDSDGDGVADYLDKCPNTPVNVQVDAEGCPIKKEVDTVVVTKPVESLVLSGDANFESAKSVLLPGAYTVLDSLVSTMKLHPEYKWEIIGHTDAQGSNQYNQGLSERRAQSVLDYLVSRGADRKNIRSVGYGEEQPISTNDTPEGRAMNRRVEIKVISK